MNELPYDVGTLNTYFWIAVVVMAILYGVGVAVYYHYKERKIKFPKLPYDWEQDGL